MVRWDGIVLHINVSGVYISLSFSVLPALGILSDFIVRHNGITSLSFLNLMCESMVFSKLSSSSMGVTVNVSITGDVPALYKSESLHAEKKIIGTLYLMRWILMSKSSLLYLCPTIYCYQPHRGYRLVDRDQTNHVRVGR